MEEEVDILKEIYINELTIERDKSGRTQCLMLQLHPATGEDVNQRWVCLTLQLIMPPQYPENIPEIVIKNPRGLSEEHIASLSQDLTEMAEERRGGAMLYELIEHTKEGLTQGNTPHDHCAICLEDFPRGEAFTRTQCYHYFHCHCLLRYVHHCQQAMSETEPQGLATAHIKSPKQKEVVCPVCREPIDIDLSSLEEASAPPSECVKYQPSVEMRQLQRKMAALFKQQKEKGGIIDLEEEKNKYLVPAGMIFVPTSQAPEATTDVSEVHITSSNPPTTGNQGKDSRKDDTSSQRTSDNHYNESFRHEERQRRDYRDNRSGSGRGRGSRRDHNYKGHKNPRSQEGQKRDNGYRRTDQHRNSKTQEGQARDQGNKRTGSETSRAQEGQGKDRGLKQNDQDRSSRSHKYEGRDHRYRATDQDKNFKSQEVQRDQGYNRTDLDKTSRAQDGQDQGFERTDPDRSSGSQKFDGRDEGYRRTDQDRSSKKQEVQRDPGNRTTDPDKSSRLKYDQGRDHPCKQTEPDRSLKPHQNEGRDPRCRRNDQHRAMRSQEGQGRDQRYRRTDQDKFSKEDHRQDLDSGRKGEPRPTAPQRNQHSILEEQNLAGGLGDPSSDKGSGSGDRENKMSRYRRYRGRGGPRRSADANSDRDGCPSTERDLGSLRNTEVPLKKVNTWPTKSMEEGLSKTSDRTRNMHPGSRYVSATTNGHVATDSHPYPKRSEAAAPPGFKTRGPPPGFTSRQNGCPSKSHTQAEDFR